MRRRKRKEDQRTRHRPRHKLRSRTRNLSSNQSQQLRKKMMLPNQRNSRTPILVCPQGIYTSSHSSSVKIEHRYEHTAKTIHFVPFISLPPSSLLSSPSSLAFSLSSLPLYSLFLPSSLTFSPSPSLTPLLSPTIYNSQSICTGSVQACVQQ